MEGAVEGAIKGVMHGALDDLLRHPGLWRAREGRAGAAPVPPAVATGFAVLDEHLPGGGWPLGALTEILHPAPGIGELSLVLPALAELSRGERWIAWIAPPFHVMVPALEAYGVDPARLMVVRDGGQGGGPGGGQGGGPGGGNSGGDRDGGARAPWAVEQALRSGACAAVLWWPDAVAGGGGGRGRGASFGSLRRLQLAAEEGAALGLVFRGAGAAAQASPAALRVCLQACGEALQVQILKSRGGRRARVRVMPWQP